MRRGPTSPKPIVLSPSTTFDFDSQKQYTALGIRPQSTPIASPILRPINPLTALDNHQSKEVFTEQNLPDPHQLTPLKTIDYSSFTRITPLKTKPTIRFELCPDQEDIILPNVQDIINSIEIPITHDQIIPRPPPLLALSQAIRRKHPEQMRETKLNDQLPSIQDLPYAPANYSFVFHGFSLTSVSTTAQIHLELLFSEDWKKRND